MGGPDPPIHFVRQPAKSFRRARRVRWMAGLSPAMTVSKWQLRSLRPRMLECLRRVVDDLEAVRSHLNDGEAAFGSAVGREAEDAVNTVESVRICERRAREAFVG